MLSGELISLCVCPGREKIHTNIPCITWCAMSCTVMCILCESALWNGTGIILISQVKLQAQTTALVYLFSHWFLLSFMFSFFHFVLSHKHLHILMQFCTIALFYLFQFNIIIVSFILRGLFSFVFWLV